MSCSQPRMLFHLDNSYLSFTTWLKCPFCRRLPLSVCVVLLALWGFPSGSVVKNLPAVQEMQEMWVQSLGWKDPLEKGMETHCSILA